MRRIVNALAVFALFAGSAPVLEAQAWAYPAFQPPRIAIREFNFAVADADAAGTTLLFQWREEAGPRSQLSLDVGVADPDRSDDLLLLLGGQYAYQLTQASGDVPLDFLLTLGAFLAAGDVTLLRLPVGVSIGHRFPLEGGMALTPWVHPRVSIDVCGSCQGQDDTDLSVSFDLGLNFELSRTFALRASALLTGSDFFGDGFGIGLVWTPRALSRRR